MYRKEIISIIVIVFILISAIISMIIIVLLQDIHSNNTSDLEDVQYQVIFTSTWSEETHPEHFPVNPHFSGLIGATHKDSIIFWEVDGLATPGIKNMAETGSKDPLNNEIDSAIKNRHAYTKLSGDGISKSPGNVNLTFKLNMNYSLVTLVAMIAPSPDWFVGVTGLNLYNDNTWVDKKIILLYPYDAGTDSGTTYNANNNETNPPEPISLIEESLLPCADVEFGTFTFTRIST
ncbi:MAG: spondin domain-containing protein [Candidatus Hodarchaeota archaeon]